MKYHLKSPFMKGVRGNLPLKNLLRKGGKGEPPPEEPTKEGGNEEPVEEPKKEVIKIINPRILPRRPAKMPMRMF
jgi:hypothetical protein